MPARYTWTISQRRALIALIFLAGTGLSIEAYRHPIEYSDPPPASGPRTNDLADRMDPNTATAAELSSIPNLGPKHADAIIAYRESFTSSHPGQRAYEKIEDLTKVKGIGRTTAEKLAAHLTFDEPATQPADWPGNPTSRQAG